MKERIIVLSHKNTEALGAVRCFPGLRVAQQGDELWVRGIEASEKMALPLRQLPAMNAYHLDEQNYLFPVGGLTPIGKLSQQIWKPIAEFIQPELPTSAMPGKVTDRYRVKLVSSERVEEGGALVSDLAMWKEYANTAPTVRLAPLRFAASEHEQVLIVGSPLPPIPGKEYWLRNDILLPSGYDFDLPLVADLLAAKLNPRNDSIILFQADGNWEKISLSYFVEATRSAIRLTEGRGMHD